MNVIPASELENHIGEEIGVSEWIEITQERKKLKSSSGKKVTNRKQAIAIALSEAKRKKRKRRS